MDTTDKRIDQLTATIERLSSTLAINERRYQAMQRKLRIASVMIVSVVLVAGFSFNRAIQAQQPAIAPGIGQQQYVNMLARSQRLNAIAERVLTQIEQQQEQMERVRQEQMERVRRKEITIEEAEAEAEAEMPEMPDMGAIIAVVLNDMKVALELVPQMAHDMHTMSVVAQEMDRKMTIITANVDSTMGRMGRTMPWFGW